MSNININFIGDIEIYKNNQKIFEGREYLEEGNITIDNISNSYITIRYKFEKSEGNEVRIRAENPRNYPPDKYAKLQIYDSNNNIYKSKKTTTTISLEIFYTFLLYCIYLLSNRFYFEKIKNYYSNKKLVIIFYILLLYFIFSPEIVSSFPVILIIDSFTIFIYLSIFLVFYFYDIKPIEVFLIALATTYLLMDLDYKLLNEYIRPGGSDSLTYESFSRLILEGSFFKAVKKYTLILLQLDILFSFLTYYLVKN